MSDKPKRTYTRPPGSRAAAELAAGKAAKQGSSEWRNLLRAGMIALWAITLAGAGYGLKRADAAAARVVHDDTRIEWVNKPAWLDGEEWREVLADLEQIHGIYPDTDILDSRVAAYVGERLQASPWIERLDRVSTVNDGRIRVYATFRRPFSLVESDGMAYLIDENAVRLPKQKRVSEIDYQQWLTIQGVREPMPQIGQAWPGADLSDGIKLMKWLTRTRQLDPANPPAIRSQLRSISVTNHGHRKNRWDGELQLITINPKVCIHWGMPPQEEYAIEAPAQKKLAGLLLPEALAWIQSGQSIDLRGEKTVPVGRHE